MKNLLIVLTLAALPFLLVWAAFILTAFSFNPIEIFQNGNFWGVSALYWFLYLCLIGFVIEILNTKNI